MDSARHDFPKENQLPPPMLHQQDPEQPWRGSAGFGLANLLNRPSASGGGGGSNNAVGAAPLPKFSLPSLHAFGKLPKPELPVGGVGAPLTAQRSSPPHTSAVAASRSKSEAVRDAPRSLAIHTSEPMERSAAAGTTSPPSRETTPRKQNNNNNNNNNNNSARRIAPAPTEEEEPELDEEVGGSIRGGRWTADEHERFLSGFRIHGHKWKRVQQVVRTRSVTQVRTHAQKYLLKVAKLKAEKKAGKAVDVSALNDRYLSGRGADSSSDAEQGSSRTAPSSPPLGGAKRSLDDSVDSSTSTSTSGKPTPRKKARHTTHSSEQPMDVLDQEYIAAAATTLCFLMTQKIDSLFDSRGDADKDALEPYDCYSEAPPAAATSQPSTAGGGANTGGDSRKRPYMHFLTESPVQYQADGAQFAYSENKLFS